MDKDTQKVFTETINRDIKNYRQYFGIDTGEISDGTYTFKELYGEIKRLHEVIEAGHVKEELI